MEKIVVIRQRPAIGDALLLGPLIQRIHQKHDPCQIVVVTDSQYGSGALVDTFRGVPGIDRIESVSPFEWTTEGNKQIFPLYRNASVILPHTIAHADQTFDCNSAFMFFEREYNGQPPYGIAEFWVRYFSLWEPGVSFLPFYSVPEESQARADHFLSEVTKPILGIVLRAGDACRDWDFEGHCNKIATWAWTKGFQPVTIDYILRSDNPYVKNCIGLPISVVAGVIKRAHLILTPDTGLLHLAEAVGTPTVALWGIMHPSLRLQGYHTKVIPEQSLGYCQSEEELRYCQCPWKFQQWSCMRRITLGMILRGLEEVIHEPKARCRFD